MNARILLLSIVLPAIPAGSLLGQDSPKPAIQKSEIQTRAEALIEKARKLSDIRAKNAPAFRLKATFSFVGKNLENEQGTYTEIWVSDSQWRRETVMSDFHRVEVGTSNRIWRLDNSKDFPATVTRLPDLMNIFPSASSSFEFESVADNAVEKAAEQCATTKPGAQQEKYRFCFDQKSGALLAKLSPNIRPKNMAGLYLLLRHFSQVRELLVSSRDGVPRRQTPPTRSQNRGSLCRALARRCAVHASRRCDRTRQLSGNISPCGRNPHSRTRVPYGISGR
jgi:hypothetical protein